MKLSIIALAVSVAFVSCGASATDSYDHRQIPFYQAKVNKGQSEVNKAQSGVNNYVQQQIRTTNNTLGQVQNAAQIANEKADAGAVRADGIEKSLANTDNRSIHNAVRLDRVEGTVGSNTTDIAKHKAYQEQINKGQSAVNAGQSSVNKSQSNINGDLYNKVTTNKANQEKVNAGQSSVNAGQASVNKSQSGVNESLSGRISQNKDYQEQVNAGQSQVNTAQGHTNTDIYSKLGTTSTTLNEYGTRLDSYEGDVNNLRNDFGSAMANIDGRLGDLDNRMRKTEKTANRAEEGSVIATAIAGHQFNTEPSAGFQVAGSVGTNGNKQAVAFGMGGALNEKWFVNAGFGTSGSTTAGVVSTTYSFGR